MKDLIPILLFTVTGVLLYKIGRDNREDITELKNRLLEFVRQERYELAAKLRDEIARRQASKL